MTRYLFLFLTILSLQVVDTKAQTPQSFNYQAVAYDSNNNTLSDATISIRAGIVANSPTGEEIYTETHIAITDNFGLFEVNIGQGTVTDGTFQEIDWGFAAHYLRIAIDEDAGTNFTSIGTAQLLTVPYALYANGIANSQAGITGPPGIEGPTGPAGPDGAFGPTGPGGETGPVGFAGPTGPSGPSGLTGEPGPPGETIVLLNNVPALHCWDQNENFEADEQEDINEDGVWNTLDCIFRGEQGPSGQEGPQGINGPPGFAGDQGPPGPSGVNGPMGPAGPAGPQGPQGSPFADLSGQAAIHCWDLNGDQLAQEAEDQNNDGFWNRLDCRGPQGPAGSVGPSGYLGSVGPQGPQGDPGLIGPTGQLGPQGIAGLPGNPGPKGDDALGYWQQLENNNITYTGGTVAIGNPQNSFAMLEVGGDVHAADIYASGLLLSSDFRYKKDIKPLPPALPIIHSINAFTYNFNCKAFPNKHFTNKQQIGLIAQELEEVLPDMVVTHDDGYKSVDYAQLIPLLIQAVKELNHSVENQQTSLKDITNTNVELQSVKEDLERENRDLETQIRAIERIFEQTTEH